MKGCRPLTDTEVELMQAGFGGRYATRDRALFLLGVESGFRISELLSLRMGMCTSMDTSWIASPCSVDI